MKKLLFCLMFISLVNAKKGKFNDEEFNKMNNDAKFEYCLNRYNYGIQKNKNKLNHKHTKKYKEERDKCCKGINFEQLSAENKKYENEWNCNINKK